MIFRPDRSPDRDVKYLQARLALFGTAAILAGAGMYFDVGWPIWGAMVLLAAGLALRFVPERRTGDDGGRDTGAG